MMQRLTHACSADCASRSCAFAMPAIGWPANMTELQDETWIVGEPGSDGPQFGVWPTLAREPRIGYAIRDWPGRLGLVAAGLGIATIPSLLADALPAGVRAVTVDDPRRPRREVLAVSSPGDSPAVRALVDALITEARAIKPLTARAARVSP